MQIRDVTIVGAGPAGLAAAISAKQSEHRLRDYRKRATGQSIFKFPSTWCSSTNSRAAGDRGLRWCRHLKNPTQSKRLRYYRRVGIPIRSRSISAIRWSTSSESWTSSSRGNAIRKRRAADSPHAQRDLRNRLFRSSESSRRAWRTASARFPLLHRAARLLPQTRRRRWRWQFGGGNIARAVSLGRQRDAGAPTSGAEADTNIG